MADLSYPCSLDQAFNFEKDKQLLVGHLEKIKIGESQLAEDTKLANPTDANYATKAVVGAITSVYWKGGFADPIYIECNVSTENQQTVAMLTHTKLKDTTVKFQLVIYAFDQVKKAYYKAFFTGASADSVSEFDALIRKNAGGDLDLTIDTDQDMTIPAPMNYRMTITLMPKPKDGIACQVAVSTDNKFVKKWGSEGGAAGAS